MLLGGDYWSGEKLGETLSALELTKSMIDPNPSSSSSLNPIDDESVMLMMLCCLDESLLSVSVRFDDVWLFVAFFGVFFLCFALSSSEMEWYASVWSIWRFLRSLEAFEAAIEAVEVFFVFGFLGKGPGMGASMTCTLGASSSL